jgi:hypothetical protein
MQVREHKFRAALLIAVAVSSPFAVRRRLSYRAD